MFIYELVSLTTLGWAGVASSFVRYAGGAAASRAPGCSILTLKLWLTGKLGEVCGLAAGCRRSLEPARLTGLGGADISPTLRLSQYLCLRSCRCMSAVCLLACFRPDNLCFSGPELVRESGKTEKREKFGFFPFFRFSAFPKHFFPGASDRVSGKSGKTEKLEKIRFFPFFRFSRTNPKSYPGCESLRFSWENWKTGKARFFFPVFPFFRFS